MLALCAAYRQADHQPPAVELVCASVELALAGDPLIHFFLIEQASDLVGYAALTIGFSIEAGGRDAYIDELYVTDEARGHGVGRSVLALLEQRARELGCKRLRLEVEHDNEHARRLYERAGFVAHERSLLSKRV